MWTYEFNRAMGASSSSALKSAAIAGASAWAFSQIGDYYRVNAAGGTDGINFGGNMLTPGQVAGQITAHAMVGGVSASLQGGKFGHGFFSAGVTKGLGGTFLPGGSGLTGKQVAYGTVVSAVIGGTASVIAGGKFANGARTGAMQYLFNQVRSGIDKLIADRAVSILGQRDSNSTVMNAEERAAWCYLIGGCSSTIDQYISDIEPRPQPGPGACGIYGGWAYCQAISPALSVSLDISAVGAYASGAGAPIGTALNGLSFANGFAHGCLCGVSISTATSVAPLMLPQQYGRAGVAISILDATLTLSGN